MNRVVLRGCEEEYLGETLRLPKRCPKKERVTESADGDTRGSSPGIRGDKRQAEPSGHWHEGEVEHNDSVLASSSSPSLVMHIRSGDIFTDKGVSKNYGQVSSNRSQRIMTDVQGASKNNLEFRSASISETTAFPEERRIENNQQR